MNSWHLLLTILAVCTVSPLAAGLRFKIEAEAFVNKTETGEFIHIKFYQYLGYNDLYVYTEDFALSAGEYYIDLYEPEVGNDCSNIGDNFNATKIQSAYFILDQQPPITIYFPYLRRTLIGELSIIGHVLGLSIKNAYETYACGVISGLMESSKNGVYTKPRQYEIMVEFMKLHPDLAKGQLNVSNAKSKSRELLQRLSQDLIAAGPPSHEAEKWKKVWADFKQHIKVKSRRNKNSISGTGGGPSKYTVL